MGERKSNVISPIINRYSLPFFKNHITKPLHHLKTGELVPGGDIGEDYPQTCWEKTFTRTLIFNTGVKWQGIHASIHSSQLKWPHIQQELKSRPIKHLKLLFFRELSEVIGACKWTTNTILGAHGEVPHRVLPKTTEKIFSYNVTPSFAMGFY